MKLYELLDGVSLTGGSASQEMEISSISCDTRDIRPGALFVALPGGKTDGHLYISAALDRGASAVLCQRPPDAPGPWLTTEDTRLALALISANWFGRPGDAMALIAVTGTNGKTTTTSLIKELLERAAGAKVGLIGTNRNMIGDVELPAHRTTPDSYELQSLLRRMADEGCTHVVMEASSHALAQRRTAGLAFDVGVFTNLTQDHLDYHHTMEEYRAAKGLLFDQCRRAVLNLDDEAGRWYLDRVGCPVFTYSENRSQAGLTARNIRLFPGHVEFEALVQGDISRVHLPIPGGFSIYNALENILTTARAFTAGRLFCLFGCGGDRDRSKRPIMGAIAEELADVAVVTFDNPRTEDPQSIIDAILAGMSGNAAARHVEPDRRAAIAWALSQGRPGDVIVLAGKGHEVYQEVDGVQHHLDEREVVAEYFQAADNPRQQKTGKVPADVI